MKITVIPDIHGYVHWQNHLPNEESDLYVFLGDYCDSYTAKNSEILQTVESVISFDKPKVLLLGNHDIQYIYDDISEIKCTGYRLR